MHFWVFQSNFNEIVQPNHNWNWEYSSNMRNFKVYRTYLQKFITIALANRPAQMKQKFKVIQKSPRLMHFSGFYSYLNEILQQIH